MPSTLRAVARIAAAALLGEGARGPLAETDEQIRKLVYGRRSKTLDKVMPVVTDLGSTYAIGGAAGTLWLLGRKRQARDVLFAGGLAWSVAQLSKRYYRRARPYEVDDVDILVRKPAGQSYPSGHPAVAAAIASVLARDLHEPARSLVQKMPHVVAFSRVYVGVHYPTDVVGGVLLGRAVGDLWMRFGSR